MTSVMSDFFWWQNAAQLIEWAVGPKVVVNRGIAVMSTENLLNAAVNKGGFSLREKIPCLASSSLVMVDPPDWPGALKQYSTSTNADVAAAAPHTPTDEPEVILVLVP